MRRDKWIPIFFVLIALLPVAGAFSQETKHSKTETGDFWICPGVETALYSLTGLANGGGVSLGYGSGVSLGLKAAYFFADEGLTSLELSILARWYFLKSMRNSGPFVQFTGGPVFFAPNDSEITIPAEYGLISAGLSVGWRILLNDHFFLEPNIKAGYPYLAGMGVSAGFRF